MRLRTNSPPRITMTSQKTHRRHRALFKMSLTKMFPKDQYPAVLLHNTTTSTTACITEYYFFRYSLRHVKYLIVQSVEMGWHFIIDDLLNNI